MKKSWIRHTIVLLILTMLTTTGFIVWTNVNFNRQIKKNVIMESNATVENWNNTVESQLNGLYEHVYDLFLRIYNNTELLNEGTPMLQFKEKNALLNVMEDKLMVSDSAVCFFIQDTDGLFLFTPKGGISNTEAVALKNFSNQYAKSISTSLYDREWTLVTINDITYFAKVVSLGKYSVGTFCRLSYFYIDNMFQVVGHDMSCYLSKEGTMYYSGGDILEEEELTDLHSGKSPSGYITVSTPYEIASATAYLKVGYDTFLQGTGSGTTAMLLLCSFICVGLIFGLIWYLYKQVLIPMQVLLNAKKRIADGNLDYRIEESATSVEFEELYENFNRMVTRINDLNKESIHHLQQQQRNELRMLRAQVKPHFYLNAITTIVNMTYQDKPEAIRTYILGLAKYLRYMLNTNRRWTTVSEEIEHIKNYVKMQEIRFPGSIEADLLCNEDVKDVQIPMLSLFTLVENSFKHAMTLYEPMKLTIRCECMETDNFKGMRIIEEDTGEGFPDNVLKMMDEEIMPELTKDHIGLSNLRYTLHLIYNRNDLLRLSNTEEGAHVELWIPEGGVDDETADL